MKVLSCTETRDSLQAFHDGELAAGDQIAVRAHLDWCECCRARWDDLNGLRSAVRAAAAARGTLSNEDLAGFTSAVVARVKAERDQSFATRLGRMFDDMHLVYASAGAATAALICVTMMFGMMRFATDDRPDSLAAIVSTLAVPVECVDVADENCRARLVERFQRANESAEQDAVFTLGTAVIGQGRIASLGVLRSSRRQTDPAQLELIEGLLDTVSRARFDLPASGSSTGMLRIVTKETVRASRQQVGDQVLPATIKKRVETQASASHINA